MLRLKLKGLKKQLKNERKKGLSEIVAYVLLIVMAISLSLLVYAWLKIQLPGESKECPENVALIIQDSFCDNTEKTINLTLKNKGLFNVYGFVAKISNKSGGLPIHSLTGIKPLGGEGQFIFPENILPEGLEPNDNFTNMFSYENYNQIYETEIIPLRKVENKVLLCDKAAIRQNIDGCI